MRGESVELVLVSSTLTSHPKREDVMYKFIKTLDKEDEFDHNIVVMAIPSHEVCLTDMVGMFADFLTACGYSEEGIKDVFAELSE